MPKVRVISHGCKSNQYDGDVIARALAGMGCEVVHAGAADAYVVNTCAVTTMAEAKGRKLVRRLARAAPGKVIATGCTVQIAREDLESIPGVAAALGNEEKHTVPETMALLLGVAGVGEVAPVRSATGRTRAVVKVQDGCDMSCSYCVIRLARGPVRSRPMSEIVRELRWLAQEGVKEVVLTGIRLGAYHSEGNGLAALVAALSEVNVPRVRLSSLDVWDLKPPLLQAIAANQQVCPHLHLPLQSGDAEILRAMRRPYTPDGFARAVEQAHESVPDVAISSDVMVGFPGETQAAFENTVGLVARLRLDGLHVFRFSARPGTAAASITGQVPESVKKERCETLLAVARSLSGRFAQRFVGKTVEVLFESYDPATKMCEGFSQHYLRVAASACPEMRNQVGAVLITSAEGGRAVGKIRRPD